MALAIAEGFKTSGLASWLGEQMIPLEGVSLILLLILITAVNFLAKITSYLATTAMLLPVLASLVLIRQVLDRLSEPYLNMNPIENRDGTRKKRENYTVSEKVKFQKYSKMLVCNYFWRTCDQQEIDGIEYRGGKLNAYEFKWNAKRKAKFPKAFADACPGQNLK